MQINYVFILFLLFAKQEMCDGIYRSAAITANGKMCARVGRQMMQKGGSVVDAAITTMLCDGVAGAERMGLGGGFALTMYHRATRKIEVLLAREMAPIATHKQIYKNNLAASLYGGLAVAVPGELKGYWELHQKYGKLPWAQLFEPAIDLCLNGVEAGPFVTKCLVEYKALVMNSPSLRKIFGHFCESFSEGKPKIYRKQLAKSLELIAKEGPNALYNGSLTAGFLADIKNHGGVITREDLAKYKPRWMKPLVIRLPNKMKIYTVPPPSSGAVLLLVLNILAHLDPIKNTCIAWQYITEALKFAYGYRTRLGDSEYARNISKVVKDMLSKKKTFEIVEKIVKMKKTSNDFKYYGGQFMEKGGSGTAHLNFIHPNGDAIAVTSTINALFGAMFRSESTGIILNNHMNDFSIPGDNNRYGLHPSPANFIEPGKIPLSSICPTLIVDKNNNVHMVVGAAGGAKIISSTAMVIFHHLWQKININKAIFTPRLHHQLLPMTLLYEKTFDQDILKHLKSLGHNIDEFPQSSAVSAIVRDDEGQLHASGDYRRSCSHDGF